MGISFDYDFGTREVLVYDAPRGSTVIVDDVKYVPERTCKNIGEPEGSFLCSSCGWGDFAPPGLPLKDAKYCPGCGAKVVD